MTLLKGPNADSKFLEGQEVEVFDPHRRIWRPAIVIRPEPYPKGKCDGARCNFTTEISIDPVSGIIPSQGGWFPERSIRNVPSEEKAENAQASGAQMDPDLTEQADDYARSQVFAFCCEAAKAASKSGNINIAEAFQRIAVEVGGDENG